MKKVLILAVFVFTAMSFTDAKSENSINICEQPVILETQEVNCFGEGVDAYDFVYAATGNSRCLHSYANSF